MEIPKKSPKNRPETPQRAATIEGPRLDLRDALGDGDRSQLCLVINQRDYSLLIVPSQKREKQQYCTIQGGAPKIAKLVYNSNNYGLWYL